MRKIPPSAERRASIFGDSHHQTTAQRVLTPIGTIRFEQARKRLAQLADREVETVSDPDVIEFLARGETAAVAALEAATRHARR